jgi:hypothetical protein
VSNPPLSRIPASERVSKTEVLNYVLKAFARADTDGDGCLDVAELQQFINYLSNPQQIDSPRGHPPEARGGFKADP